MSGWAGLDGLKIARLAPLIRRSLNFFFCLHACDIPFAKWWYHTLLIVIPYVTGGDVFVSLVRYFCYKFTRMDGKSIWKVRDLVINKKERKKEKLIKERQPFRSPFSVAIIGSWLMETKHWTKVSRKPSQYEKGNNKGYMWRFKWSAILSPIIMWLKAIFWKHYILMEGNA